MHKIENYKIENGQLYLEIIAEEDYLTEFSKDFFTKRISKFKYEILKLIKKNKINFARGRIYLLINGTIIATMFLTSGCAVNQGRATNNTFHQESHVQIIEDDDEEEEKDDEVLQDVINDEIIVELKKMNLLLIAGHANKEIDPGAVYQNRYEALYTHELVKMIEDEIMKIEDVNINVITESKQMALADEVVFLKQSQADYAISIHFNAGLGSGTEIIVPYQSIDLSIAEKVIENFRSFNQPIRTTPIYSRSSSGKTARKDQSQVAHQRDYYAIIRAGADVLIPSDIIEVEFIDNVDNMAFYDAHKDLYAKGIADAIISYYRRNYIV